jgi:hypothetical protein
MGSMTTSPSSLLPGSSQAYRAIDHRPTMEWKPTKRLKSFV